MRNLRVTLIQTELSWFDVQKNIGRFDAHIKSIKDQTDLVILPEMFTTGFIMQAEKFAEEMSGDTVRLLLKWAKDLQADITGSVMIKDRGRYYNRLIWARPNGEIQTYDKRHLFCMAGEDAVFTAGNKTITIEINGWKLRPFICYDLRFPVWTRNKNCEYDALICVANWPEKRAYPWKMLLRARAIENQCYVIGVNCIGTDDAGSTYCGDSAVIDFMGNPIFEKSYEECLQTIEISYDDMRNFRESFPAWKDADDYSLK